MKKIRVAGTIVYPESATSNWIDILSDEHIPLFISPLHTDEGKKEHYHVMFVCSSPHNMTFFEDIISKIGGVGFEKIGDTTAYARYLCHLDNDDKIKYDVKNVIEMGGLRYQDFIKTKSSEFDNVVDILRLINQYSIHNFAELVDLAMNENPALLSSLLSKSSVVILVKEYIRDNNKLVYERGNYDCRI